MRSRKRSSELVQVTARWNGATLGVWCLERGGRFRVGRDAECEFPVDAETCDVVTADTPASPRQFLAGGVSFDVDAIGAEIQWQASPRRLPLLAATMIASFAVHVGAVWSCSAAHREREPIDPATRLTARQLAAIRGYLERAEARVESDGPVEETPSEPAASMPSLAPSWGSRQLSCRYDEECVASAVSDGACCTPVCARPYVYSAAFARALEQQWQASCPASGCGPVGITVKCAAGTSAVPWCKEGTCVDARHEAWWDRVPYDSKDYEDLRPFLSESQQREYVGIAHKHEPSPSRDALEQERAALSLLADGTGAWFLPTDPGPLPVSRAVRLPDQVKIHIVPLGVWGGWKKEEVTQTIRMASGRLMVCSKMELTRGPAVADGAVMVRLLRNRDGSVDVRAKSASPSALTRCVVDSLRKLDFPAGQGMGEAEYRIWFEQPSQFERPSRE